MPIKHYVVYLYRGSFFPEEEHKRLTHRKPDLITAPTNCFAFYFYDRMEEEVEGRLLKGEMENISGRYYPQAEVFTREDVVEKVPDNRILLSNMDGNGWERVVKTRLGNIQPLEKNDVVLE